MAKHSAAMLSPVPDATIDNGMLARVLIRSWRGRHAVTRDRQGQAGNV